MVVLKTNQSALIEPGWEWAGVFPSDDSVLYVRHAHSQELPIVHIVARLSELTTLKENVRGQCHQGPTQVLNQPLVSDPRHRWSYDVEMPGVCNTVDPRYHQFDSVDLEDHFLQNVQALVRPYRLYDLHAVHDPRYQAALDPNYLISGVKCSNSTRPCVRDPLQHVNCASGDVRWQLRHPRLVFYA